MKYAISMFAIGFGLALSSITGVVHAASNNGDSVQVATLPVEGLPIEVSTACENGTAIFRVVNAGGALPSAITFNIIQVSSDTVVSKRRMNLVVGQRATFKVKDADKNPSSIGLFMDAKWLPRDRQIDASIRCGA